MLGVGIVLFFTLFATFPLFGRGYIPTHDGEYHIIRFIEFFRMISAGYWFPRWAPTLNSGYGIPIFLFHYPFPNYVGAFIQFLRFDSVDAFKLCLAFGYITAGFFSFLWLKKLFGTKAGLVGAVVSSFVPYWFVELYVRGSVGEVWAIAFVFAGLMLLEYEKFTLFSLAVCGLILSHNILAMLFIPFFFGMTILRNKRYTFGILFGVLLSSYFWIPAIFERMYVVGLNTVNFREHFVQLYELLIPSWGTELSGEVFAGNKMSFQIGIVPLFVLLGSLLFGLREKRQGMAQLYWYFFFVFFCAMVLTLSSSSFLWLRLPLLQYVQYPWRFLSFVIPFTAFTGAYVSSQMRERFMSIMLILVSVIFSYSYLRPVVYAVRDSQYYLSRKNFTDGTSSMGNSFSTIWTGWKNKRSEYILEIINGKESEGTAQQSYLKKEFTVLSQDYSRVFVPILYYPGWRAIVDKREIPIDFTHDGTIQFSVSPGKHKVTVEFTQTPLRKFSDILSIFTLVWIVGWGILGIYDNRHRHIST